MLLSEEQLQDLDAKVAEAQLISALIAEVRHHRENAEVPQFVCPHCNADDEYGFSCGEDRIEANAHTINDGGSQPVGNVVVYNYVCTNCDSRGEIAWKVP